MKIISLAQMTGYKEKQIKDNFLKKVWNAFVSFERFGFHFCLCLFLYWNLNVSCFLVLCVSLVKCWCESGVGICYVFFLVKISKKAILVFPVGFCLL